MKVGLIRCMQTNWVVLSLEKYAQLTDKIEIKLDEADIEAKTTDIRYSHDEVFSEVRNKILAGK